MNQIKIARPVFQSPFDKARSAQVEPMAGHDGLLLARLCILAEEIQKQNPGQPFKLAVKHVCSCFDILASIWRDQEDLESGPAR